MITYSSHFERELKNLLNEQIQKAIEAITNPMTIKDYAEYRHAIGKYQALREALELCDEANSIIQKQ